MTKLTKIDVADVEHLLKKIAFDANTLTVGDTKQAQALLAKINPPEPTLVELIHKERNKAGMPETLKRFWDTMDQLAYRQEARIKELTERVEMLKAACDEHAAISTKRFGALNKIAYHKPDSYDAYALIRQIARDALQEKS